MKSINIINFIVFRSFSFECLNNYKGVTPLTILFFIEDFFEDLSRYLTILKNKITYQKFQLITNGNQIIQSSF